MNFILTKYKPLIKNKKFDLNINQLNTKAITTSKK